MKKLITQIAAWSLLSSPAFAASNADIEALQKEVANLKKSYEVKLTDLEKRISETDSKVEAQSSASANANLGNFNLSNKFNPSIGVVLNGRFSNFTKNSSDFSGFGVGEEGLRGPEGFSLGESEINFASNIDDKFSGSLTASITKEDGQDKIELEEAFIQTRPELGLPQGLVLKGGRAFWKIGYLNDHHTHSDDFADRPLPYRAFLNNGFNDDGMQASYLLPTNLYSEIGGGAFRGDDFPSANGGGRASYSLFARVGDDIGLNQNWRLGLSFLSGKARADGRKTNEDNLIFNGKSDLYIADFRYTFAPTGNPKNKELTLQGEYFYRAENGSYEDKNISTGTVDFSGKNNGWYVQSVYKFRPTWRVGLRYSQLAPSTVPQGLAGSSIDALGVNPKTISTMIDWSNSEFSTVRLQYNNERIGQGGSDNQIILQYVVSFGAHAAHSY